MNRWTAYGRAVLLTVLTLVAVDILCSQSAQETAVVDVLQSHLRVLAGEFGKLFSTPPAGRFGLHVEGLENRLMVENAFIDVLSQKNIKVVLSQENVDQVLEILVLEQSVSYEGLTPQAWKRTIQTRLEARLRTKPGDDVQYFGSREITKQDSVLHKEEGWSSAENRSLLPGKTPGATERLLVPLTVIASTVVIVYLFFTVRN